MSLVFLEPYFQEKIWGGNKLNTVFGMDIPSERTGEAWVASAHPNGVSTVSSPKALQGLSLDALYEKHPELFGPNHPTPFPLLIKIIDAKEDLSVQVHPDDYYAHKHEGSNEYGKNECWYVIAADEGAKIVYGHNAKNRKEFEESVKKDDFDGLLRELPVQKGDFFDVPAGTIHAIGRGVMILETQQSSDTTYRVYDYDRKDEDGQGRELHLKQSADVTLYPHKNSKHTKRNITFEKNTLIDFVSNEYFSVQKATVEGSLSFETEEKYYIVTVVEGKGEITIFKQTYEIKNGDSFIIPYGKNELELKGDMELIFSSVNSSH